jgi:hypothetical protein
MAVIERHPDVADYFVSLSLAEIARRGGVADLFEEGRLILLSDYRLDFDFEVMAEMSKSIDGVDDPDVRRKLKKLTAPYFFKGKPPRPDADGVVFPDPVRQAIHDVLCRGDTERFNRAAKALRNAHDELLRIFRICFPDYDPFRIVPSVRLTRTLFENLHWDNHSIDDDFHQARIFANLGYSPPHLERQSPFRRLGARELRTP